MLTRRSVLLLAVLTILVAGLAAFAQYDRWSKTIRTVQSELAFPDFATRLPAAARIRVLRAADNQTGSFDLARSGDQWVMTSKGGFPASQEVVRELLIGLSDLRLIEAKTRDPDRHAKLHLDDTTAVASRATRLVVEDDAGNVVLDGLFGKSLTSLSGGKPSIYIRRTGDPQSWLATGEIAIRGEAREWLPVDVLSIRRERIESIVYRSPDAAPLELIYNATLQRYEIVGLPADREVKSRYELLQTAITAERMMFQDVRPADSLVADPGLGNALWRTMDGLTVTLALAPSDRPDEPPWVLFEAVAAQDAEESVRNEAAAIETRLAGWAFRLDPQTMQRLRATMEGLTRPKESG